MKIVLLFIALSISLLASATGDLSLFVLKEGKPLKNQTLIIYKQDAAADTNAAFVKHAEFITDSDGALFTVLPIGSYQVQVLAKDGTEVQAFVKKHFVIEENKESQIIISLKKNNELSFDDRESPASVAGAAAATLVAAKEKGDVQISLVSAETQKPIAGARVFVKGLSIDAQTDAKGNVLLNIPVGEQTLSIIHSEFSSQSVKVNVDAKVSSTKFVELSPASMELDEFIVLAPQVEGSVASLIAEKKNASAIADILGSEEMSKKGDSNAAAALKRVSGVTLVDGKNVYVRGLGERYANVELNSMPLPSPDPYKRVVPLDIFPSSIIGSLKVQKTYSADLPGNFGGGYIDLRTKEDVSEDFVKLTLATKAHDSALDGTEGNYYAGGSMDYFGIDDGSRRLPSNVLNAGRVEEGEKQPAFTPYGTNFTKLELWGMTKDMARRSVDTHKEGVPLGSKIAIELGKKIEINADNTLSILASYSYDQDHKHITEEFYGYSMDGQGVILDEADTYGTNERTYSNYKQNAMLNLGYNYADVFKLKYTSLFVLDTLEKTRVTDGVIGSNQDLQRLYSLDWEEKTLFANQLTGLLKHKLISDAQFNFGMQWSIAELNQPGNIKYDYIDYTGTGNHYQLKTQSAQNLIQHELLTNDDVKSFYLNEVADISIFSDEDKVELGVSYTTKTRESRSNKFYLKAENASNISYEDSQQSVDFIMDKYVTQEVSNYETSTFLVKPIFSPSDYYDADFVEKGFYVKTLINPIDSFELSIGARKAVLNQTLHEYGIDPSTNLVAINDNEMNIDKWLPNIDMRFKFTDNDQLRFGYSITYIYPDFREFSSSGYFHPDESATVIGNPNLTHTDLTNYDLRFEHYFSATESFSTAVFYKTLTNPIEDVSRPSTSLPIYSYENTDSATLLGLEIEASKGLDFVDESLENYYTSANFTYTKSDVSLSQTQEEQFTTNHRELQGLSPIVINANIGYDNTDGRILNLAYNYMSRRIRKVGLKNGVQEYPDQYEYPPHLVDFTWQENLLEGMDVKFKAGNLLNGEVTWMEGDNITKRYKPGRSYELSLSYKY
ncbi:MAG: carboxypeptidase-like regulatory domain-containing protein [Sulfurimonas sp.]|nr:carboxypeptidase-like regulatory domain-containing protein [Sulfurimonas sp.]